MKNYIKEAIRTKSNQFFGDRVKSIALYRILEDCWSMGRDLDVLKRELFYGQDVSPLNKSRNALPTVEYCYPPLFLNSDVLHGIIGLITESAELAELLWCSVGRDNFNRVNLKEELGDVMWYIAIICNACGWTFEEIQETNINKLKARFPEKFTKEKALNRNLDKERRVLES